MGEKKQRFLQQVQRQLIMFIYEKNTLEHILRKYTEYTCTFWVPNGSGFQQNIQKRIQLYPSKAPGVV